MKTIVPGLTALLPLTASLCITVLGYAAEETPPPADPGWPREHILENKILTVYQPQVDAWKDHSTIHFRCAIEAEGLLKAMDLLSPPERLITVSLDRDLTCLDAEGPWTVASTLPARLSKLPEDDNWAEARWTFSFLARSAPGRWMPKPWQ